MGEVRKENAELESQIGVASKKIDKLERSKSSYDKKLFLEKEENQRLAKALEIERFENERLQKEIDLMKENIILNEDPKEISFIEREQEEIENLKNRLYELQQLNDSLQWNLTKLRTENNQLNSQLTSEFCARNEGQILISVIIRLIIF